MIEKKMTKQIEEIDLEELKDVKGFYRIVKPLGNKEFEDLRGQKFGKLTPIKPVGRNKQCRVLWLFICDCGNNYIGVSGEIKRRGNCSCGCSARIKPIVENLTGKVFGEWTVVEDIVGPRCLCRCSCGTERWISKSNLKSGGSTNCGCKKRKKLSERRFKDLKGQTFGRLTVLEEVGRDKFGRVRWKVRCSCGTEFTTNSQLLLKGSTASCGCLKRDQTIKRCTKPMVGKIFGRLTVIRKVDPPKKGRGHYYECLCSCGNTVVVQGSMLRSGNTRSCGCLAKDSVRERLFKDLTGQRFGKLTVIKEVEKSSGGDSRFLCKCDCGGYVETLSYSLTAGEVISCGCVNSKGEYYIAQILDKNNIPFLKQKSFDDLRNGKHGILRFDFYITEGNYLIEFDGPQHEKPGMGWNKPDHFKKVKHNDNLKNEYCKAKGIHLIRIPYSKVNDIYLEDLLLETSEFVFI